MQADLKSPAPTLDEVGKAAEYLHQVLWLAQDGRRGAMNAVVDAASAARERLRFQRSIESYLKAKVKWRHRREK